MAPKYRLVYFNSRGTAELTRYMFAYGKIPYEDVRIEREQWPEHKSKQPFGQLPVLEIDGFKLAESGAISRYVAREVGLAGKDNLEAAKCDMILSAMVDVFANFRPYFYEQDPAKKEEIAKKFYGETVPPFIGILQKMYKENGSKYFVGNALTWADLAVASALGEMRNRVPKILDKFADLAEHTDRILNIPQIKEWREKRPKTEF